MIARWHRGSAALLIAIVCSIHSGAATRVFAQESALPPDVRQAIAEIRKRGGYVTLSRDRDGPYVAVVGFSSPRNIGDDDVHWLARFEKLRSLDLIYNKKINGKGLAALRDLKHLHTLRMSHTRISDAALKAISGITSLKTLELGHCAITDDGMKHLAKLKNLEKLDLRKTVASDTGVAYLAKLTNLQKLRLWKTGISDTSLAVIGKLPNLAVLCLRETGITNRGIRALKSAKKLRILSLRGTKVTDDAMTAIARLPALHYLDCFETKVTEEGFEELVDSKTLQRLYVPSTVRTANLRKAIRARYIYSGSPRFPF